jgi:hypothetical protein
LDVQQHVRGIDCDNKLSIVQFMTARDVFETWLRESDQELMDSGRITPTPPCARTQAAATGYSPARISAVLANTVTDGKKQDAYNVVGPCGKYRKGNGAVFVGTTVMYLLIVVWVIALMREAGGEREGGLKKLRID